MIKLFVNSLTILSIATEKYYDISISNCNSKLIYLMVIQNNLIVVINHL